MALELTHRLPPNEQTIAHFSLSLTAEERTRSRHYFETAEGQGLYLRLPRGTMLRHGDLLRSSDEVTWVRILAKPEPVMTVMAHTPLDLLRGAYHLGNRHVPLEVKATYLRLSPDPVLRVMLDQLGLHVIETIAPFEPETGAYGHSPAHSHEPEHTRDRQHRP
ncbi:MAG: urease accessory protein UreE [Cyanobacteria bacterium CRU_2_1]|nr:urease accessory protein UreE [Cyanobacteria bacterium RU_5_0]NJR59731.1 urease accessory protein UreE [Cyanobacteria bacterium CRU_2_1]